MLLQTKSGLLNIFIEPQFANLCQESLYTIQATDFKSIESLELASYAEHKLDPEDSMFPFTAFAYAWHLEHILTPEQIQKIETVTENVNPEPSSYCWAGVVSELEDVEFDENSEESLDSFRVGYCLANELQESMNQQIAFESFLVYPLYRIPTNHELKTIWIS